MFTGRSHTGSAFDQVGQQFFVIGAGIVILLLAGCSGKDASISDDDVLPPAAVQGTNTQVLGTIADSEGNPLAEVGIAVTEGSTAVSEILVLSGEDGKYTWPLPAGTFTLTARKDGYKESSQEVVVKEGETTRLDFTLEKLP
ncbi:conserved hypothetical protein [Candidatus Denitrolinea symbiosum]|jgi:hypothetical protein|nr:conserved hypothetical protein [Candidatus Denitrolinea symbiosum]